MHGRNRHRPSPQNLPHCRCPSPRPTRVLFFCPVPSLRANHGPLGNHPLCCNKSGDRITRHNRLRNLVFKLADTGLLAPELEKLGILGVTDKTRRRPVMFQSRAGVSVEALPSMSPSSTLSPPLSSGKRSPASHTLKPRKLIVMLPPSFIGITISPQLSSRLVAL